MRGDGKHAAGGKPSVRMYTTTELKRPKNVPSAMAWVLSLPQGRTTSSGCRIGWFDCQRRYLSSCVDAQNNGMPRAKICVEDTLYSIEIACRCTGSSKSPVKADISLVASKDVIARLQETAAWDPHETICCMVPSWDTVHASNTARANIFVHKECTRDRLVTILEMVCACSDVHDELFCAAILDTFAQASRLVNGTI
jgi:hypothetical protein